jgi:hypothetical protein
MLRQRGKRVRPVENFREELTANGQRALAIRTNAQGGTRTRKTRGSEDFESSASTNSTT